MSQLLEGGRHAGNGVAGVGDKHEALAYLSTHEA